MEDKKELVKYLRGLGLTVNTSTKARGHQGFFLKNRIDISKNIPEQRVIPTLLHEFAHYVHYELEPKMNITGGSFEAIFGEENALFEKELFKVTNFVDENSLCVKLYEHKDRVKTYIKEQEEIIKADYPDFMRSKSFKEFEKYIKKSEARYLLKYDRVRIITGFWKKSSKLITVNNIEQDFPDMPKSFAAYIRLRSAQKKQSRISARINKLQKYYKKPTELFARLVEGLYMDKDWVKAIAPYSTKKFYECLKQNRYKKLNEVVYKYL
jgi:hypothetical protein